MHFLQKEIVYSVR